MGEREKRERERENGTNREVNLQPLVDDQRDGESEVKEEGKKASDQVETTKKKSKRKNELR